MNKQITIADFLTDKEIKECIKLKTQKLITEKIIGPNIERINKDLDQENDPRYLGYLIEYVIGVQ